MGRGQLGRVRAPDLARSCRIAALALLAAVAGMRGQGPGPAVFTADVRLVTLPATVKDAHGAPVGGLDREDFSILEEGEPRELVVFERRTNRPLSVVLMVDVSLSTAIELRYERESAGRFLSGLLGPGSHPSDQASVFSFSSEVEVLQAFTRDHRLLSKALSRVRPQTGTSVYDAVLLASKELEGREGRRVIVIITDGGDTTSSVRFADALRAAHGAEAAIYPLIVLPIQSDAGRNRGGEHALITLAKNTGGESFVQYGASNLDESFGKILRNLRTQYLLGYYLAGEGSGDGFRSVEVRVSREGAVVLVRSGYFAAPPVRPPRSRPREAPVRLRSPAREREAATPAPEPKEIKALPPRRPADGKKRPPIIRPGP